MEVIKGVIVHALANHLEPKPDSDNRVKVLVALHAGLVKEAIHRVNLDTGSQKQRYDGEFVELMFDYIEGKIGDKPGIKIGRTGMILTRANLAEALDDLREHH